MYNIYIILGEAHRGREQEFADWYSWIHIFDVMRPREAAIAATCFRLAQVGMGGSAAPRYAQRFLALFENDDPVAISGETGAQIPEGMLISSAADHGAGMGGGYYDTVAERTRTPGQWPRAGLILEWIERPDIDAYIKSRFAAATEHPAMVSGWIGKASDHQLYEAPRPAHVAIYRTRRLEEGARALAEGGEVPFPSGWERGDLSASCFAQYSERVTRAEVLAPDVATVAKAEQVRAATTPMVF